MFICFELTQYNQGNALTRTVYHRTYRALQLTTYAVSHFNLPMHASSSGRIDLHISRHVT